MKKSAFMHSFKTFILFYRKKLKMFANSFNSRMTYTRNFFLIWIFTKFCMSFGLNMNFAEKLIKIFIQSHMHVSSANKLWNSQILLVLHRDYLFNIPILPLSTLEGKYFFCFLTRILKICKLNVNCFFLAYLMFNIQ